jgi:uncharacterized membrane protein
MMTERSSSVPRTAYERVLQLAGVAVLMALCGYAFAVWGRIPPRVPVHFGARGLPDAWGARSSLLLLPVLGVALFVVLTVLERFPRLYNYPVRLTAQNAEALFRLGRQLVVTVKLTTTAILAYLFWASTRVALGEMPGLHRWFFPLTLAVIGATLAVTLPRMIRLKSGARPRP